MSEDNKKYSLIIRNFVFGVEDSLVSTVGLLAGIAFAGVEAKTVVLTGAVLIFVEAFSMGVGSLLSEQSVEQYEEKKEVSLISGVISLLSSRITRFNFPATSPASLASPKPP